LEQTTTVSARSRQGASLGALLYWSAKRLFDVVGSAFLLVVLSPVFVVIAIAILADDGLPILYRCERAGRFGLPITVLKFRTMRDGSHHHLEELLTADEERRLQYNRMRKLKDDPRRTRIGAFLRRTSLDELPQLLNVLAGNMSLIGPRPYFRSELADRREAKTILKVRPGITGLWQVNGRSDRTFEERLKLDMAYVRGRGFRLDGYIVLRTFSAVISGRGAY
jgi:lipopolysaccharide/colanic/teichoic acid biosynthesis glycosyltransferase